MKIIHVIGTLGLGGAQSLLVDLAASQKELGHEVSVVEISYAKDSVFRKSLLDYGIKIEVASRLSVYNPLNIFRISKFLKEADIVHVHLFPALYWVAIAKKIFGGRYRLVYTEHNTSNKRRGSKLWHIVDQWIYKKYDRIVACSNNAKTCFEESFPKIECLSIPNGINLERFKNAKAYSKEEIWGVPEDVKMSTMVARLEYPKRQEVMVQALKELPENFHCAFVGGKEKSEGVERVRKVAENLGVTDRVHFMYTRSDVPRILKTSDFVVLSSDYEGLSLSMIEGMVVGKPFIASDAPGITDIVVDAGILFAPGDSHALASIQLELEKDVAKYNEVAKKCSLRAEEYNISNVAQKYVEVYMSVL